MDEKQDGNDKKLQPLPAEWPYSVWETPFVKVSSLNHKFVTDHDNDNLNNFLCILGGNRDDECKFKRYNCTDDKVYDFVPAKSNIQAANASLKHLNMKNPMFSMSYLVNDDTSSNPCILVIRTDTGYSCYNINNDQWIVKNSKTIKPSIPGYRSILISNSYVHVLICFFCQFFSIWHFVTRCISISQNTILLTVFLCYFVLCDFLFVPLLVDFVDIVMFWCMIELLVISLGNTIEFYNLTNLKEPKLMGTYQVSGF